MYITISYISLVNLFQKQKLYSSELFQRSLILEHKM